MHVPQGERGYTYGPVTEVDYIHVEYGHFDEYMAWVTSTWVPTMEAAKNSRADHRLQGLPGLSKITGPAQCVSRNYL
jgi:hypothetical protein